jgi:NAD(P)-dependent dehydrogenase (short-subunit alcohol dehydrogenase family)
MSLLQGKIAVVTGAGRGIGRAVALRFAAEGADVVCVSRTPENSEKVAGEVRAAGRRAWAHALDVADAAAVTAAAEAILAAAGRMDILVNNAGVTRDGLLMRMSEADWDTVLNTNLRGAFTLTKAFSRSVPQATVRPDHQRGVRDRADWQRGAMQLRRQQGGPDWADQVGGPRTGLPGDHLQRHRAGIHHHRHDRRAGGIPAKPNC